MIETFTPFFRRLELTRDYSEEELNTLINTMDVCTFEMGQVILDEGQQTEGFHFLFSGDAEVWKGSSTSKDSFLIESLHPGALFGEMSVMTGEATSASVRAKTVCTVLILRKTDLLPHDLQVKLLLGSARNVVHRLQTTTERQAKAMAAEAELKLAWNIQKSFLPSDFPVLENFDIYGTCEPARDIGGDYFDVFQIDGTHFGLVIGDVSGKGVPAAIFMSGCRTLFRTLAGDGAYPNEVLRQFNKRLVSLDQNASMFITIFYGILDVESGRFIYASAGHNMPFVRVERGGNVSVIELKASTSLVAGIMEGIDYTAEVITLLPGDLIVLYTDGITEAINNSSEQYGEDRLAELIAGSLSQSAAQLTSEILVGVDEHQAGQPRFDDETLLIVRMK